jgi:hypothetical protein
VISGQTGISAARRYLVIADVAGGADGGPDVHRQHRRPADVTTTGTESGDADGAHHDVIRTVPILTTPTATGDRPDGGDAGGDDHGQWRRGAEFPRHGLQHHQSPVTENGEAEGGTDTWRRSRTSAPA